LEAGAASGAITFKPTMESSLITATPLVTLAVTTRNRLGYLRETLARVRAQDYSRLEVLISDNASESSISEEVRALASSDPRFRFRRNDVIVPAHEHFTQCAEAAKGEYFILLHDDDLINPSFVSKLVEVATRYPDANVVVPLNVIINEEGKTIRELPAPDREIFDGPSFVSDWLYHIEPEFLHNTTTILVRTKLVRHFDGYQGLTRGQNSDNLLFLQCGITARIGFAREAVFYCRSHGDSLSGGVTWQVIADSGLQFMRHLRCDARTRLALRSLPETCRRRIIRGVQEITARDLIEHMRADPQGFGWRTGLQALKRRRDWTFLYRVGRECARAAAPRVYYSLRRIVHPLRGRSKQTPQQSPDQGSQCGAGWRTPRRLRVALFGHFALSNFGNDSTLSAILSYLRRGMSGTEFKCICTNPQAVERIYNIAAVPSREVITKPWASQNRLARWARRIIVGIPSELCLWLKSLKELRGTDALIIPGTGLLSDACTLFDWGPYDMFRWSVAAKLCGCKLLFVSVGAGPVYSRKGKFLVKTALSLADYRSYRDESTLQYLTSIGFRVQDDRVYPDLAFGLSITAKPPEEARKQPRLMVGLGLMSDAGRYGAAMPKETTYPAYLEAMLGFAEWLLTQGYDVRLLTGDVVDTPVTAEFKPLLRSRVGEAEGRCILEPVTSVECLLSQLAATDVVVATRFHNVLLSLALNKPVIALSFHHKCSSLMSQMGLSEYCQDIDGLNGDKLIEQFRRLQQNTESVRQVIREKVETCRKALDEQYDIVAREICPDSRQLLVRAIEFGPNTNSNIRS
jgi:polysaccharide pyruvyl transferase WcaK-like protein